MFARCSRPLFTWCCSLICIVSTTAAFAADAPPAPDQKILDLALEPPRLLTSPDSQYSDEERDYGMTIGIERTPGGRLWACWVAGGDSDKGYFVLASSDDEGRTWSHPKLVLDPPEAPTGLRRRILVGCLWCDPTGKLWLFFDQSMGYYDGRAGDWAIVCENPDAANPVWSDPRRIWHGATLNKPTVLTSGEWLLPISLWQRVMINPKELRTLNHDLDDQRAANVFASNDQGKTWSRRGGVVFPEHSFDEHMVIERRDGSLWMLARTNKGIAESISTDRGVTWSEPRIAYPHVVSRFFIRRLASGRLLFVRHGRIDEQTKGRSHLTAYLSDDDGRTWQGGLMLDERNGVSYPDGFQAPDGRIFISYDRERAKEREILLAVFSEEDILAGKPVTPTTRLQGLINKARGPKTVAQASTPAPAVDDRWTKQAVEDAKLDRTTIAYDGISPNKLVCDTTLRQLPDGTWAMFMLAGDDFEPSPKNYIGLTRSSDEGKTWSKLEPVETTFPHTGLTAGQGPTELIVDGNRCTLFFSTHSETWGRNWKSWLMRSDDNCKTWSKPELVPGRLGDFTFIRNSIVLKDGRIMAPFQKYLGPGPDVPPPAPEEKPWHNALRHYVSNPRNGVMVTADGGQTWKEYGNVRLTKDDRYHGWAENNIVELSGNRIAMIIRGDRLGGVLYYAESKDGGVTWPEYAQKTDIPNPGSKATLYPLGNDCVAMLHNPNPSHRSPLSLWVSFDGMKTWPYRRVLVPESIDGPKGKLNYPDGFVSKDKQWLHFGYDDNRHNAVYYGAKLPPLP
ncbi:sialidase family protein [Planctomicrobium piriforme]|uniref:BNR repeat-like domain-containing protein n=1 Tax=Planctomicrobium piriforme TaxID=1576369 RepID=A0A1I3GQM7_9PLAN|nr:sialidase family protein [Planctomicrobium piriforme]SFI25798.1 BNR repeat-like domain-containing protein [Planctomicrobium piriforme]